MNLLQKVLPILLIVILTSCAAPKDQQNQHLLLSEMGNDFGSGIGTVIDYATNGDITVVTMSIDNPSGLSIEVWITQSYTQDGFQSIRKRRVIQGHNQMYNRTFRTSVAEQGVKEVITLEIFDSNGEVLFKTKPIVNENLSS